MAGGLFVVAILFFLRGKSANEQIAINWKKGCNDVIA